MGIETTCRVSAELKVLLETDEIIVRGRIPFSAITRVNADRGRLVLHTADGDMALELDIAGRSAQHEPPTLGLRAIDRRKGNAPPHDDLIGLEQNLQLG